MFDKQKTAVNAALAIPGTARTIAVVSIITLALSLIILGVVLGSRNAH